MVEQTEEEDDLHLVSFSRSVSHGLFYSSGEK